MELTSLNLFKAFNYSYICQIVTLDVDCNARLLHDDHWVRHICDKIEACRYCCELTVRPSSGKGYHIIIKCAMNGCIKCRLAFDDQERYRKDSNRRPYAQGVLFDSKNNAYKPAKPYRILQVSNNEQDRINKN